MVRRISQEEEKRLADRLKREAEAMRPAFDAALHARICGAVRQPAAQTYRGPETIGSRRRLAYAAVAAAGLVSWGLIAWQVIGAAGPKLGPMIANPHQPSPDPRPGPTPGALADLTELIELSGRAPQQLDEVVVSTLSAVQWAELDHDARLAASLLFGPLPPQMLASAGDL